jgi:HlyD family secretion protein
MKPKPTASLSPVTRSDSSSTGKPRPRAASVRKLVPYAIGAALLISLILAFKPKPVQVEVATVATAPLVVTVLEEGKTRIRHRYMISPPLAGMLRRVELRAGARVEAGKTVLAMIDPQPASFLDPRSRAEAEARVKVAEASKMERETQIDRARAALDLAKKDLDRASDLRKKGAIAAQDWDTAENKVTVLTRELNAAQFALQAAESQLQQANAALIQAQAPASANVEPVTITSPIDGFVLQVMEENARFVTPGITVMEVGSLNDLEAEIELLSSDAVGIQPGSEASIEQWGGDKPLRGKVTVVEPGGFTKISALGVEEQRVKVRVDFLDPLPPGTFLGDRYRVEARIVTWRGDNVLQLPTGALFRRGGEWMAFLVDGRKARLRKVEIAHNNGVAAELRDGLKAGETVIVHAPDSVADGVTVKPRPGTGH